MMKIELKTEGGIAYLPGLRKPVTVDTQALPAEEAAELEGLVKAARVSASPEAVDAPARGAADYQQYTLTVEDEGQRQTLQLTDPVQSPELQSLLTMVREKAAQQAKERGGG